jgi:hypothetical protein
MDHSRMVRSGEGVGELGCEAQYVVDLQGLSLSLPRKPVG